MNDGYAELEFDLPSALLRDIVALLDGMNAAELTSANLTRVRDAPGVYALISGATGELLYIGKAESSKGLLCSRMAWPSASWRSFSQVSSRDARDG